MFFLDLKLSNFVGTIRVTLVLRWLKCDFFPKYSMRVILRRVIRCISSCYMFHLRSDRSFYLISNQSIFILTPTATYLSIIYWSLWINWAPYELFKTTYWFFRSKLIAIFLFYLFFINMSCSAIILPYIAIFFCLPTTRLTSIKLNLKIKQSWYDIMKKVDT